jgi:aminoglycoside 2'-N-acetyltransferase I
MATGMRRVTTDQLSPSERGELRALFDEAWHGDEAFDDDDWEHALGGIHAIVEEDGSIVAHGAVVQRRLLHAGRALRTGYVEGVAVRPDRQRHGLGTTVMHALAPVIRGAYAIGALAAAEQAGRLYRSLGWSPWRGATWVLSPEGIRRTADEDGGVYVLPLETPIDLAGDLVCDWRDGDVW